MLLKMLSAKKPGLTIVSVISGIRLKRRSISQWSRVSGAGLAGLASHWLRLTIERSCVSAAASAKPSRFA